MNQLTATFRIVTPMFLGGADPTTQAELRVPSIKGALRFWWRALMWGKIQNIAELRRQEADLFGSSDVGQSKFLMRIDTPVTETHAVQENWLPASWQRYTGYGIQDKGKRRFLKPGREFSVHLNMRRCSPEHAAQVISAIQMFGLVGGLGSRARKGWGSLTLTKMEGSSWISPATGEAWKQSVQSLIKWSTSPSPYTSFTTDSVHNSGPMKNDAAVAQQWLGQRYQEHVKATDPKAVRAQFGLPRNFKRPTTPRTERRASQLLLHIHQCPNGKALPCAVWLPATFLSNEPAMPGNGESARRFVEQLSSAR